MIITGQMGPIAEKALPQIVDPQASREVIVARSMGRTDDPPPYSTESQHGRTLTRPRPPIPRASSSNLMQQQPKPGPVNPIVTNHIFLKTRHEPITGIFNIDPELQTVALDKAGATAIDRRDYNCKHRQRHRHHGRKSFKKRTDLPDPNAIFETRQGALEIELSVMAPPNAAHLRTLIQATTRQGPIDIAVRGINTSRCLNMEVSSRHGDITILIPRSYSGYIQVYSRNGQLTFLPSLSQAMTLVSRYEREAQVVVGNARHCAPPKGTEWTGDMIHAASRKGDVFIGFIGEDQKPSAQPGLWTKLAIWFQS